MNMAFNSENSLTPQIKKKAKLAKTMIMKRTVLKNSDRTTPEDLIASKVAVVSDSEFAKVSETSVIKKIPQ